MWWCVVTFVDNEVRKVYGPYSADEAIEFQKQWEKDHPEANHWCDFFRISK